jgi:GTPase SAR1 family protein
MAIKIQSTKDYKADSIKAVVYGPAGIGKTVLCSTAPKPIIVSSEAGLLSLSGLDIPYMEVSSLEDLDQAYRTLKGSEFDTICLDSLSEIAELVLKKLKDNEKDPRQAYLKMAEAMLHFIRNFRDIKQKHVVFITKMETKEDDVGITQHRPILPGQMLPTQLPYMVDELFCMVQDKAKARWLQTESDRNHICKDRSGKLNKMEPPNLTEIFSKIGVN